LKGKHGIGLLLISLLASAPCLGQMITGIWKGKINRQKCELKIIQNGDSLAGTSYYYESANNYRRYSIKGFFDANTNEAVWWDDQLIEEKPGHSSGKMQLLARADFNCPGGGKMMLDGKAGKISEQDLKSDLHFDKIDAGSFEDEWDYVIDNYLVGANDPYIIDSINAIASNPYEKSLTEKTPVVEYSEKPLVINQPRKTTPIIESPKAESLPTIKTAEPAKFLSIEEKFITRKKVLITEIPVTGDSIELRFYDNAEIDGDSISLFLNDHLIFRHIRLTGNAYTIKLAVSELGASNELIMVAENLGSIPPNTSFMVAVVGEKRYEARLESTEGSSAMIRFVK